MTPTEVQREVDLSLAKGDLRSAIASVHDLDSRIAKLTKARDHQLEHVGRMREKVDYLEGKR